MPCVLRSQAARYEQRRRYRASSQFADGLRGVNPPRPLDVALPHTTKSINQCPVPVQGR